MKEIKQFSLFLCFFLLLSCGNHKPSSEELKKIDELKIELTKVDNEVKEAENKNATYSGGLIKVLVNARIEILKTNKALIEQRINALETGAKITIETFKTETNPEEANRILEEIEKQNKEIESAKKEACKYSGGLILAMKQAAIATQEQTIAMLKQKYLIFKYGLGFPNISNINYSHIDSDAGTLNDEPSDIIGENKLANEIISVKLLKKRFAEQDYQDYIFFDIEFDAIGLDKPTRAIKGSLNLQDLFGETKLRIGWIIDKALNPGGKVIESGTGFKYNQFMDEHQWTRTISLQNMKATFTVKSIIYKDGTQREL